MKFEPGDRVEVKRKTSESSMEREWFHGFKGTVSGKSDEFRGDILVCLDGFTGGHGGNGHTMTAESLKPPKGSRSHWWFEKKDLRKIRKYD